MNTRDPHKIHEFWFADSLEGPAQLLTQKSNWFGGPHSFDDEIRERFGELPSAAVRGELDHWRQDRTSTLSLILVLDQFPRNLYRGLGRAYDFDWLGLKVALSALGQGIHTELHPVEALFMYLPLQHAEDPNLQDRSVTLFEALPGRAPVGTEEFFHSAAEYARLHRDIITRFERFPHRNLALGRQSTVEEQYFLDSGGETFGVPQRLP